MAGERGETTQLYDATLEAAWDKKGIQFATIRVERGTCVGTSEVTPSRRSHHGVELPCVLDPASDSAQIRIAGTLGMGGMGIVRLGIQTALEREVAVKTIREDADRDRADVLLLREAHITGALEHPNVVPIYTLGSDPEGRPVLVMKRIEGRSWADLLASAAPEARATEKYLREHLEILHQVARAVGFAHKKGILHRDIKPDNVMIGLFGEVYLVDWGIAVRSRDEGAAWLPLAAEVDTVEGTPGYMAPEMAAGIGSDIGERSDVYLLGATLHEVLTGAPPHAADTLLGALTSSFKSTPRIYPEAVPAPLAALCHRAMARFPGDRHESADAFRKALAELREHHVSMVLAHEAHERLERFLIAAAQGAEADDEVHALFAELRFGFQQALRAWRENLAAARGLRTALERMVEYCLDRGAVDAAATYLRELQPPAAEQKARVDAAVEQKSAEQAQLRKLEHDKNLSIGETDRRTFASLTGIAWGIACVFVGMLARGGKLSHAHLAFAALNLALVVAIAAVRLLRPDTIGATAANRRLTLLTMTAFSQQTVVWLLSMPLGMPTEATAAMHNLMGGVLWAIVAFTVDPSWLWLWLSHVMSLVTMLLAPPGYAFEILGAFGVLGTLMGNLGPRITRDALPSFLRE